MAAAAIIMDLSAGRQQGRRDGALAMRAVVAGAIGAVLTASWAHAIEGTYRGSGSDSGGRWDLEAEISPPKDGRFKVKVSSANARCVGEMDGVGVLSNDTLRVSGDCDLTIAVKGNWLRVTEGPSCGQIHGAGCDFSGSMAKSAYCPITQATLRVKDNGSRYAGQMVERPDLVGKTFRVTRYTERRKKHLSPATGDYKLLGYEGYEIKGRAGTFHIKRDHVDGSPAVTPLSWVAGTKSKYGELKWGGGKPERVSVGQGIDYLYDGPLTSLVLEVAACPSARGASAVR